MNVPFIDLKRQYKNIEHKIDAAVKRVLSEGAFILGPEVARFESALAEYCGCSYVIGVASGTDALLLSLLALGIGPGDEVITSPFTFVATASSVTRAGATPVFVDISPRTYNIDSSLIETAITRRTRAIIPVHLYGQPADMSGIREIAERYGLFVVEDAAQAIDASYRGKKAGTLGNVGAVSFFPTKNLGAYGDGGAVLSDNATIAERIDLLRRQGARNKYFHELVGMNSRLDALQAAVLHVKLGYIEEWRKQRRAAADRYNRLLEGLELERPYESGDVVHSYHQYTIKAPRQREELRAYLLERSIQTMIYYPHCLHQQPIYRDLYVDGTFPMAEEICGQVLSLPCFPEITEEEQVAVVDGIRSFYGW